MRIVKMGSRDSALAVAQARLIMEAVAWRHPEVRIELVTMKTSGDTLLDRPLEAMGGKGLFVKELDDALAGGRVDICVHSYKDLPVPGNPALPVVAVSRREDPRDVLVLPEGMGTMPAGLPIGTSSLRRRLQAAVLFPGSAFEPVRGNIATRLRKLDSGQYGALILAAAGMRRLGLWERAYRVFTPKEILPAACQGMLAVQGRAGERYDYLDGVEDADARDASTAERAFIEALEATCASPVAAFAEISGENLTLAGLHVDANGAVRRGSRTGNRADAAGIGRALARELKGGAANA